MRPCITKAPVCLHTGREALGLLRYFSRDMKSVLRQTLENSMYADYIKGFICYIGAEYIETQPVYTHTIAFLHSAKQ